VAQRRLWEVSERLTGVSYRISAPSSQQVTPCLWSGPRQRSDAPSITDILNVSLDGFRAESHGRFRGNRASFQVTVETVRKLAHAGLLQGLLCTPNNFAEDAEYAELCAFAVDNGAEYVLLNPLSAMGREVKGKGPLGRPSRACSASMTSPSASTARVSTWSISASRTPPSRWRLVRPARSCTCSPLGS